MTRLRRWLARKLWPEVFAEAERGRYMAGLADDLRWWCGEFPDVAAGAEWLLASTASHYRPLGAPPHPKSDTIDGFRERLRRATP